MGELFTCIQISTDVQNIFQDLVEFSFNNTKYDIIGNFSQRWN